MKDAQGLLSALTAIYPPEDKQRHSITLDHFDSVAITLMRGDLQYTIMLSGDDMDKPPIEILTRIIKEYNRFVQKTGLSSTI